MPGKNTKILGTKRLFRWTLDMAMRSGLFAGVYVCTDDPEIVNSLSMVQTIPRPPVVDDQPDVVWVREALAMIDPADAFAILRPTSPFRTAETIRRAWHVFQDLQPADSLRAVRPVTEHPGKMWTLSPTGHLEPITPYKHPDGTPWHSSPTQTLKSVYVQDSSLEIAWTKTVTETGTISGTRILPFYMPPGEGLAIDTPEDWAEAERRIGLLV